MRLRRFGIFAGRLVLAALAFALPAAAQTPMPPDVELERLGEPTIDRANNYSENTRVRIRLVRDGMRVAGWRGAIRIEEWNSQVYDGLYGATQLPMEVAAPSGETIVVLKSLARFAHFDMRNMPIPQIAVHAGGEPRLLQIPQWVDADGDDKTDWLQRRVDDLLARARASAETEVARAAAVLTSWEQSLKRDCGGFDEAHPNAIMVSPACVDFDGADSHRINRDYELTATVLHEMWHAWSYHAYAQAPGKRRWPKLARPLEPIPCPHGCNGPVWLADPRYESEEEEAETFAERYKHLFP